MKYVFDLYHKIKEIFNKVTLQYLDTDDGITFDSHNPTEEYGTIYIDGDYIQDCFKIKMSIDYSRIDDNKFKFVINHPVIEQFRRNYNAVSTFVDLFKLVATEVDNWIKAYNQIISYIEEEYSESNTEFKVILESLTEVFK